MSDKSPFQQFCAVIGADPDDENVHLWYAAAEAMRGSHDLDKLCRGFDWHRHVEAISQLPRDRWIDGICEQGLAHPALRKHLGHLLLSNPKLPVERFVGELLWRTMELERLNIESLDHLAASMMRSTTALVAGLECLRTDNEIGEAILEAFPELNGLRSRRLASVEHDATDTQDSMPLLEHLVDRSLNLKLLGLERADIDRFQSEPCLSEAAFGAEVAVVQGLESHGLMPLVRTAMTFLDFAKGGGLAQRERWIKMGADLTVHNEAAAVIIEASDSLRRFPRIRSNPLYAQIVVNLVRYHGTVGQAIRGESPLTVFGGFIDFVKSHKAPLAQRLLIPEHDAADLMIDMLHVINVCDTAGVREGLFTDELRFEFVALENLLRRKGKETSETASSPEMDLFERSEAEDADPQELREVRRQWLWDRLCRLRRGRILAGEPAQKTVNAVRSLSDDALNRFCIAFSKTQLWYCELATSDLTPLAQIKLLALAVNAAHKLEHEEPLAVTDLSFEFMVESLEQRSLQTENRYRLRLLETILRTIDANDIILSNAQPSADHLLGSIEVNIGGHSGLAMRFETTPEAEALITLLSTYERRSAASFHSTLKHLCDLYGLRKDEFDRLANEANYLQTMNAARSDKERMLDFAKPGTILEIGPGGGVILDLLEQRFPSSKVIGVDVSAMVVEALEERRELEKRKWSVIEADAFELEKHFEVGSVDTVILCSLLHEIYSYVDYEVSPGERRKFRLESVRDLIRSAYAALKSGGRIIIRDGIMPPDEPRIIEFHDPDGPEFFRLFAEQFEGRTIHGEWLTENRLRLSAPDAMEFLYCYTWGPESFPYEVREQYGVLPYDEYCESIKAWLGSGARIVEVPEDIRSYLQPGYKTALAPKVTLRAANDAPIELPDSNALIVIEKP